MAIVTDILAVIDDGTELRLEIDLLPLLRN